MALSSQELQRPHPYPTTSILKILGQHCHGEKIEKEEVFEFRTRVKIRALESYDNCPSSNHC